MDDRHCRARPPPRRAAMADSAASRGLVTVVVALVALFLLSLLTARSSLSHGAIDGMLPFAAVLAVRALGQTLVVMQGGIDLSIPGTISLAVVIVTHEAYGDRRQGAARGALALGAAVLAGLLNGFLVGRLGLNSIVATLGTNALLYAGVLGVSGGTPRQTTDLMAEITPVDPSSASPTPSTSPSRRSSSSPSSSSARCPGAGSRRSAPTRRRRWPAG